VIRLLGAGLVFMLAACGGSVRVEARAQGAHSATGKRCTASVCTILDMRTPSGHAFHLAVRGYRAVRVQWSYRCAAGDGPTDILFGLFLETGSGAGQRDFGKYEVASPLIAGTSAHGVFQRRLRGASGVYMEATPVARVTDPSPIGGRPMHIIVRGVRG
jgi:hypothetical protein